MSAATRWYSVRWRPCRNAVICARAVVTRSLSTLMVADCSNRPLSRGQRAINACSSEVWEFAVQWLWHT
jgi:hypothetical protein